MHNNQNLLNAGTFTISAREILPRKLKCFHGTNKTCYKCFDQEGTLGKFQLRICPCALLIKHYAMKTYGGMGVWKSALVGVEWSASRPRLLYPRGNVPRYPLDIRLVVPQNRSGRRGEEKIFPLQGLEPRPLGCQARSQSLYILWPHFQFRIKF
jgi:hypothetical protein